MAWGGGSRVQRNQGWGVASYFLQILRPNHDILLQPKEVWLHVANFKSITLYISDGEGLCFNLGY